MRHNKCRHAFGLTVGLALGVLACGQTDRRGSHAEGDTGGSGGSLSSGGGGSGGSATTSTTNTAGGSGGTAGVTSAGGSGGVGGSAGGSAGSGGGEACAGLGCVPCSDALDADFSFTNELCHSGQSCETMSDCSEVPGMICAGPMGTGVTAFQPLACLDGQCILEVSGGSCIDGTPCDECNFRGCSDRGNSAAECATCCSRGIADSGYDELFSACACADGGPCEEVCATSAFCGGEGEETEACTACLIESLLPSGACVTSSAFQQDCIHEQEDGFCAQMAQCLLTCDPLAHRN